MPKHVSIPIESTVEILNVTPLVDNPLLDHCEVKVCYLGENRNGSVIDKATATKMAKTLHGCPIAGFYDEAAQDFAGHNRSIEVGDGKFRIVDKTKAYGFVDSSARIWFQKFLDDNKVEREYLMTEGYLWTTLYPESKRILTNGNNQSMELNEEKLDGTWTYDDKGFPKFFIINEAMIQKLCILGEDVEPCFEGAGIAAQFSFDGDFKNKLFSLMEDIKSALSKGGFTSMENEKLDPTLEDQNDNPETDFAKKNEEDEKKENPFPPKGDDEKKDDEGGAGEEKKEPEEDEDEKKKKAAKNSLTDDEVAESELYKNLAVQFTQLQESFEALKAEVEPLRAFKLESDRKAKQEMIDRFYMLSDDDKKDCVENIDTYSLDDIEAKLSVICVRNKVSFNLDNDKKEEDQSKKKDPLLFSLDNNDDGDSAPAWIKAVRATAKEMN